MLTASFDTDRSSSTAIHGAVQYDTGQRLKLCGLPGPGDFPWLRSPDTGITLTAATDMPGVQLYSGNWVEEPRGKRPYGLRSGVCLESQFFPNAMGLEQFQKPILRASEVYDHWTEYRFGKE